MSVKISSEFSDFPACIEDKFEYHRNEYKKEIPTQTRFPVYGLPENKFLLLDGNHRAVELFKAYQANPTQEFHPIELWAIRGPICQTMLPDLKHWQQV